MTSPTGWSGANIAAVRTVAADVIGAVSLRPTGPPLRGSDRAVVVRAAVDGGPRTVVVKAFAPVRAGEGGNGRPPRCPCYPGGTRGRWGEAPLALAPAFRG
jgi:hypothetical protein